MTQEKTKALFCRKFCSELASGTYLLNVNIMLWMCYLVVRVVKQLLFSSTKENVLAVQARSGISALTLVPWQKGEHRSSARSICTTGSGQMGSVNQSPTIKHLMLVLLLRSTFNPMLSSRTTPDKCKTASSVTFAHRGCSIDFVLGNSGTINLPSNFLRVARAGPCSDCSGAVGHRGGFLKYFSRG